MKRNNEARKKVRELWEADKNFPRDKAARDFGVHRRTINKWVASFGHTPKPVRKGKSKVVSGGGLDAFRMQYDDSVIIPQAIEEGIEKYLTDKDGDPDWMKDKDFREACGIPVTKWRRYADDFKDYQAQKQGEIFWAHLDIIDEIRKALNR